MIVERPSFRTGTLKTFVLLWSILICSSCSTLPRIRLGKAEVTASKDAGTPATLKSGEVRTGIVIPANSKVSITKVDAVPATTETAARPASETVTFDFSQASEFVQQATTLAATTGTIDSSVSKKRIETESKAPLLYAALGAGAFAIVAMILKWPTVAVLCGAGSGAFFAAWKLADMPWWGGVIALAVGGGIILGYMRSEADADKDGISDRLQATK